MLSKTSRKTFCSSSSSHLEYVWFNKYHQATYPVYMDWLYWCTNRLLGKESSNFVSVMHKISTFPSTILSKSPDLFLIELIFRYEKITLLRWECCNLCNQSNRGPIYLLDMLSTRSYLFKTFKIFFTKIQFFANRHNKQNNIYFVESRGEWICRH